jgi:hypothetical protein
MNTLIPSLGEAVMRLPDGEAQEAAHEVVTLCADGLFRNRRLIVARVRALMLMVGHRRSSRGISAAMSECARDTLFFLAALDAQFAYARNPALREELDEIAEGLLEIAEEHIEIEG